MPEGVQIKQEIQDVKRLTSDFFVSKGIYCMNEDVCEKLNQREFEHQEKETARVCKAHIYKKGEGVMEIGYSGVWKFFLQFLHNIA